MSQAVIARRYAKALMNLASQGNLIDTAADNLNELSEAFSSSREFQSSLTDNKIPQATRQQILVSVLEQMQVDPLIHTFARFLFSKGRIMLLPEIGQAFDLLVKERTGKLEAEVTVSESPSEEMLKSIQSELSASLGKDVSMSIKVDPSIIGGVVARVGSTVIDGSLRTQLRQLRQSITQG